MYWSGDKKGIIKVNCPCNFWLKKLHYGQFLSNDLAFDAIPRGHG